MDSILNTIKGMLGIPTATTNFDLELIGHINTVFMVLNQLGVGPINTFSISSPSIEWKDFIEVIDDYAAVKSYIYMKVKLIFDPPQNSFLVTAIENQILEYEERLREQVTILAPSVVPTEEVI